MGRFAIRLLRAVLVVVLLATFAVQVGIIWILVSGRDPEDGSVALLAFRIATVVGLATIQVIAVCVWHLVRMVENKSVFSNASFRYVDAIIGSIVAAAIVWFAVTAINAPDQRDDPGVTLIMGVIGLGILGVALVVYLLRTLLAQAIERDIEAAEMQAELDRVI